MNTCDLRCYFVTRSGTHEEIVARATAAAEGGAGLIQVRSKPISARDLYELSRDVVREVSRANPATRVVIDDRLDVALALQDDGIAGVHLGQDDIDVRVARRLLGPEAIIGLTTGTLELVHSANEVAEFIDYIGAGPFRATPTKDSGRPLLGLEGYPSLVAASAVPIVAIGDVTVDDAAALASTGVDGLAIVRGIMNASNPKAYVEQVISEFDRGQSM